MANLKIMKQKLKELSKESLQKIILEMSDLLSDEQLLKVEEIVAACSMDKKDNPSRQPRMSQELVDDKWKQLNK